MLPNFSLKYKEPSSLTVCKQHGKKGDLRTDIYHIFDFNSFPFLQLLVKYMENHTHKSSKSPCAQTVMQCFNINI